MSKPSRPQLPVRSSVQPVDDAPHRTVAQSALDPAFAAQALGQNGQKRGLKGGAPVLDAARKSYLQAQWSGPGDRRTPAGVIRKDEV